MVIKNSCGQTITQYNVQTGDAVNNLNQVAPAASGTVLTSNGVSSQPSFQAVSNPSPSTTVFVKDDFIGGSNFDYAVGEVLYSELNWLDTLFTLNGASTDSAHPGVLSSVAIVTVGNFFLGHTYVGGMSSILTQLWILGGGQLTIDWVFKINTLSAVGSRYVLRLGMGVGKAATDQTDGVYFEYSDNINSGNWNYKTANASTRTTTNSSTAVTTGWHHAQFVVNAAASSISFTMDGVSLGAAITTNIPTASIVPFVQMGYVSGSATTVDSVAVDLFYATQTLTTPR